ncbi:chromosome segregation protein SMC [Bacillus piscicola]|uniref:chromosome segregation protein SMC n=1 Tax=Bacillus piscicola TaxID=1632684 RepID=UPI001F08AACC|nr:chromosome segregation protein SMC [Bacillus piscicola]
MFLKKLEIKGFKSFAEEMNIEFVPGVNVVVGPNGSGKSNISDSIRWVLGEQSARSLRGAKMEDVIFSGSDSRRALNRAEVTLVLDNEDGAFDLEYSEVSVTRKLYRNGESEYLINRQPCRRKDIVDLFTDSGIGKAAYSIIGQGKVEEVLSSKPEERRTIFEEAAGVLKYKQRKYQAEKKLSETKDNLERVQDILFELEGQLEPLKEQAAVAKDYLYKQEDLERKDIALLAWEIEDKHEKWTTLADELEVIEEKKDKLTNKLKKDKERQELVQAKADQLDKDLQNLQDELLAISEWIEKEEGRRRLLEERGKNANEKKAEWSERIAAVQHKAEQTMRALEQQRESTKKSSARVKELEDRLMEAEAARKRASHHNKADIEHLKSEYIERLNEQATIRNEERYVTDQQNHLLRKSQELLRENEQYLQEREQVEQLRLDSLSKTEEAHHLYEDEQARLKDWQEKWQQYSIDVNEKEKKLYEAYRHVDQMKSRIRVLEEMEADYAGFFEGVKEILKARDQSLGGIAGAVAELIDVPKSYLRAVETALGGALQHIVTDTEANARKAIHYLKSRKKGRATFLPANVIRPRQLPQDVKQLLQNSKGFVAFGEDAVRVAVEYEHIIGNLLGQVVLADSLESANQLARSARFKARIVTLEGDVVNPGGSMTGGTYHNRQNQVLGRQQELEERKATCSKMEKQTEALETSVHDLKKKRNDALTQVETYRKSVETKRDRFERTKEELTKREAESARLNTQLSLFDREMMSLEEEKERIKQRQKVLQDNKAAVERNIKKLESEIASLEHAEKEWQEQKEELAERETVLKIELARAKETAAHDRTEQKRLEAQQQEEEKQIESLQQALNQLEQELSPFSNSENVESMILDAKEKKEQLTFQLTQLRKEKVDGMEQAEQLQASIQQLTHDYNEQQEAHQEMQVAHNRIEVELDTRLQRLQETYEVSFERAKNYVIHPFDPVETKNKIKLLRKGIAELGTVNLGAIEEYDRVQERVMFLSAQQDDLIDAEAALFEVIQEMDAVMKQRFTDSFTAIRHHFQATFQELFGGGEADLYLTEPQNLLDSGVDITARPPGKKKQHLTLLSGGEKALTAIALLFSIIKAKPVPFCVLDEVEAALDEANLVRFASHLRTFSQTTQFIVISHRKATMEEADVLYGITMEESGVSKKVAVKLEDTDELIETPASLDKKKGGVLSGTAEQ